MHPFNRHNLYYEVKYFCDADVAGGGTQFRQNGILEFIRKYTVADRPLAGIVYCRTKASCDELAAFLKSHRVCAAPYHR